MANYAASGSFADKILRPRLGTFTRTGRQIGVTFCGSMGIGFPALAKASTVFWSIRVMLANAESNVLALVRHAGIAGTYA